MDFAQVKAYIEANKENAEVTSYIQGLNPVSVEGVSKFLTENNDGKKWFDSERDKHLSKGIDTWKTNNLQKLIDDAVTKVNPQLTPEQKQLAELQQQLEQMKKESSRKELTNTAIKHANEKKLPIELVDYLIGDNEESTLANIGKLEQVFGKHVSDAVEAKIKGNSYTPPAGGGGGGGELSLSDAIKERYTKQ